VQLLSEIFRAKTVAEWVKIIGDAGVPCGPINRVSDVVNDPQVLARNMMVDIPHPKVPDLRVPYSPLKLTKTPPSVRHHPPLLGQNNEEILLEMGYSQKQISALREKGIIGKPA
jgi:crotonobetainyl-CoA:carnitine CoA-transferase CaiB-like acyl-CoA transferase